MSGGSFEYLYLADIVDGHRMGQIEEMAEELRARGHHAAAERTMTVVHHMRMARAIQEELGTIWHNVEWWRSGDSSAADVDESVRLWTHRNE